MHRIGQEKTVYVKHFIVCPTSPSIKGRFELNLGLHIQISDTIEGRVLEIQKRKTAIVKEAFKGKRDSDPESIENLKIMFGDD